MRSGTDSELLTPRVVGDLPLRLSDSSAAEELACLLDTQVSEVEAWLLRVRACVAVAFGSRPQLLPAVLHGLTIAESSLKSTKAAERDSALAELDELLFALSRVCPPPRGEQP